VAGGTGISAFAAFLAMLTSQRTLPVTLVYGARSPDLLLFDEMILGQHRRIPALQVVFSRRTARPRWRRGWNGSRGHPVFSRPDLAAGNLAAAVRSGESSLLSCRASGDGRDTLFQSAGPRCHP